MKKMLFAAVLSLFIATAKAQEDCVTPLMVLVPEQVDSLAPMAQARLESKLRQIVAKEGLGGGAKFSNFSVVANITEDSKEVISGMRPLVTVVADLELFVGNNYTGEKFASTAIQISGAGRNETKAYIQALGGVSSSNAQIQRFLKDAKRKINQYYAKQVPTIIRQAKTFAVQRNYEEAMCLLTSVPACCNEYADIEQCMLEIFQQYVDYDCAVKVNKARAVWIASQDKEGATLAGAYLASIDPASSCWDDALTLADEIRTRIGDDWEFSKELLRDAVQTERDRIDALKAIGVAFGENQKAVTIRENWLVR